MHVCALCSVTNETKKEENDEEEESDVQGFLFGKLKWVVISYNETLAFVSGTWAKNKQTKNYRRREIYVENAFILDGWELIHFCMSCECKDAVIV